MPEDYNAPTCFVFGRVGYDGFFPSPMPDQEDSAEDESVEDWYNDYGGES